MYSVKEIFYSLQGEGAQSGRPAIFLRFAGCNLWNGREQDRANAICSFCDTDFVGTDGSFGGKYPDAKSLVNTLEQLWPKNNTTNRYVICTGGEPLLQLDEVLIECLHEKQFTIAIETNGTIPVPAGIDWICMSPKPNTVIEVTKGNELKFVFPQSAIHPSEYEHLDFENFYIQPMDSPTLKENMKLALDYCLSNPKWKLSLQTHKILEIR